MLLDPPPAPLETSGWVGGFSPGVPLNGVPKANGVHAPMCAREFGQYTNKLRPDEWRAAILMAALHPGIGVEEGGWVGDLDPGGWAGAPPYNFFYSIAPLPPGGCGQVGSVGICRLRPHDREVACCHNPFDGCHETCSFSGIPFRRLRMREGFQGRHAVRTPSGNHRVGHKRLKRAQCLEFGKHVIHVL